MTYYRLAVQDRQNRDWIWKTSAVTSLQALLQLLRSSRRLPQDDIRVFTASSREELNEMLSRQNNHLPSGSVPAAQFLQARNIVGGEQAQSASEGHVPAHSLQQGADWATVLPWGAQAALQGTGRVPTSPRRESQATTGRPSSLGRSFLEEKRLEIELGPGADHDTAYLFTLPVTLKERLAWIRLQKQVQAGQFPS